ncbi:16S rRNA (uracil(1498)-N(3))-methyltransferase [Sphingomonas sp. SFZ2018-12]|uniref:16S rRNA (uracil(1498)-N(3))-methyltransferase n=1 Tax=Sphingomonas sp. SFZ2018-12 TaxID=2683197 RepID=UPI001F0F379B|nr:16S rRNA (uracil(1498)-N(3))-methyltransferase [Sphingomonas sp. SFZ2018-12]MCH4892034.1 16S rRNA (uracil(1498)-N(3))-methyltransferase [Sphingomonas sp. SFZ2018-12]
MPATPAWPPQSTPRLFVPAPLASGQHLTLDGAQAHYLIAVMRLKAGDPIKLCDDATGEWLAVAESVGKRALDVAVREQLRARETVPDLWLCAAPIKKGRIDWVIEKACELGVDRIRPVLTRRSVVDKLNLDRLGAHMVEAAEQCGRTALPRLLEPVKLPALLADWPADRALFFADESGGVPALAAMRAHRGPGAILIGPEGGFDAGERDAILTTPGTVGIALGPRILRADTAAVAAIGLWMAAAGDWS